MNDTKSTVAFYAMLVNSNVSGTAGDVWMAWVWLAAAAFVYFVDRMLPKVPA